jgi:hypothetical protein
MNEYWILPRATVLPADGRDDIPSHAAHAVATGIQLIMRQMRQCDDPVLRDLVNQLPSGKRYGDDAVMFRMDLLDAQDRYSRQPNADPAYDDLDDKLIEAGIHAETLAAVFSTGYCPRDWARKHLGWISVAEPFRLALYGLTDDKVARLRDGLWTIINREGGHVPGDMDQQRFTLYDARTITSYDVTWLQLQEGRADLLSPLGRRVQEAVGY